MVIAWHKGIVDDWVRYETCFVIEFTAEGLFS